MASKQPLESISELDEKIFKYFGCSFDDFIKICNKELPAPNSTNFNQLLRYSFPHRYSAYYIFKEREDFYLANEELTETRTVEQLVKKSVKLEQSSIVNGNMSNPVVTSERTFEMNVIARTQQLLKKGTVINSAGEKKLEEIKRLFALYANNILSLIDKLKLNDDKLSDYLEFYIMHLVSSAFSKGISIEEKKRTVLYCLKQKLDKIYDDHCCLLETFVEIEMNKIDLVLQNLNNFTVKWFTACCEIPKDSKERGEFKLNGKQNQINYWCLIPAVYFGEGCSFLGEHAKILINK